MERCVNSIVMSGHLSIFDFTRILGIYFTFSIYYLSRKHHKNATFLGQNPTEITFSILLVIASVTAN